MVAVNIRTEAYDERIDRQTRWGNPFRVGSHGSRADVIQRYREHLWRQIRCGEVTVDELARPHCKRLGCWCAPLPCHGDVLTRAAAWTAQNLRVSRPAFLSSN